MPVPIQRPTDYIYTALAEQVYYPGGYQSLDKLPKDWIVLEVEDKAASDGYYAVAYVHKDSGQMIISHRGVGMFDGAEHETEEPLTGLSCVGQCFRGLSLHHRAKRKKSRRSGRNQWCHSINGGEPTNQCVAVRATHERTTWC